MLKSKNLLLVIVFLVVVGLAFSVFLSNIKKQRSSGKTVPKPVEIPEVVRVVSSSESSKSPTAEPKPSPPAAAPAGVRGQATPPAATGEVNQPAPEPPENLNRDPFAQFMIKKPVAAGGEKKPEKVVVAEKVDFKIEGVWWSPQGSFAIINGDILKEGDRISGYEVKQIFKDRVLLFKNGDELVLYVEEPKAE